MYTLLAFFLGVIISFMISINGGLAEAVGVMPSTVIIHAVGTVFALLMCVIRKEKLGVFGRKPFWLYLGGAFGVLTTVFQNYAFSYISMTSIIALGLLGQTITSLVYDRFGLMGMPKRPFEKSSIIGIVFAIAGILVMLDTSVLGTGLAVALATATGVTIVVSRTINNQLSEQIGPMPGSLVNHIVGLIVSLVWLLVISGGVPSVTVAAGTSPLVFFGGVIGVFNIFLMNIVVSKMSSFRVTVLTFVGQILSGVLLDLFAGRPYDPKSLAGGLIIAVGVAISMIVEHASSRYSRSDPL